MARKCSINLLVLLLFLIWSILLVVLFRLQIPQQQVGRDTRRNLVRTFPWKSIVPELSDVMKTMRDSVEEIISHVSIADMAPLYTCKPDMNRKMVRPASCLEDGRLHLQRIISCNYTGDIPPFFSEYDEFEDEDRGHGSLAKSRCQDAVVPLEQKIFQEILGANVSVQLRDRTPCHSSYSFSIEGMSHSGREENTSVFFGRTHHFGSISIGRESPWGVRLQDSIQRALGNHALKYVSKARNMRGFYWYPPHGFTEWHTDTRQVKGWRLYLVMVLSKGVSKFAYFDPETRSVEYIDDVDEHVNMFQVDPEKPLWHAVYSENVHRFTVGIAISDAFAEELKERLDILS